MTASIPAAAAIASSLRYALEGGLIASQLLIPIAVIAVVAASLAYLYAVLYDDSNFCAIWIPMSDAVLAARQKAFPILSWFAPAGEWESNDRGMSFFQRLGFCFAEFTVRRRYYFSIEAVALLIESAVLGISGAARSLCAAQLLIVMLVRIGLFLSVFLQRPQNTRAGVAFGIAVSVVQIAAAGVYFGYVVANFTNTLRSATRGMLLATSAVLFVVSVIQVAFAARLRIHRWIYDRGVTKDAERAYDPQLRRRDDDDENELAGGLLKAPPELVDSARGADSAPREVPVQDLDFTKVDARHDDDGQERSASNGPGIMAASPFGEPAGISQFDDEDGPRDEFTFIFGAGPDADAAVAASSVRLGPSRGPEDAATKAPKPKKPKPPPGPNVWRVIALEDAHNEQCAPVPIFEDDLL
jgi:nitrogen fixation-related uncharacterized protein